MPRIEPLERAPDGALAQLNVFKTIAKHSDLAEPFNRLGGLLLSGKGVPVRERELVILRVAWRTGSGYEWGQHVLLARQVGLTAQEIARLRTPGQTGWSDGDRPLIALSDELCQTDTVSDPTWTALAARFDEPRLIELTILVGFYRMVAGFLNALDVEIDDRVSGWEPT